MKRSSLSIDIIKKLAGIAVVFIGISLVIAYNMLNKAKEVAYKGAAHELKLEYNKALEDKLAAWCFGGCFVCR